MRTDPTAPILVSGAHRTGTTWVGRVLAAAPGVAYISEPLNALHRPGVLAISVPHWYTYICAENADTYLKPFRDLLGFRYAYSGALRSLRSVRDVLRMGRDVSTFVRGRMAGAIPLLKDPFAVFSLDWFVSTLGFRAVVTVRHPAAFASGLKRLGWSFDFAELLDQPLLMRDLLGEFRGTMQAAMEGDVVDQAGVLWAMIYRTLRALVSSHPSIAVVRHEDVAAEPLAGFRSLYDIIGLPFTARVERSIEEFSGSSNPAELSRRRTHSVKMDSRTSLSNWRRRLSEGEVKRVRKWTDGVWQEYYPEASWN